MEIKTLSEKPTSLDLMSKPFAWIEIPNKDYSMAKYPVTNAQFAEFIKAGGYQEQKWWTKDGWAQWEQDKWTAPRYWQDSKWNSAEQPVVGVSWYESVAFCLWLSEITGEKIILPTEEQWQYAAQGDDDRVYPWGDDWDSSKCRNSVGGGWSSAGNTSPVRQFEGKGDSPFGVVDMAGNVWEWCLTDYEKKNDDFNSTAMFRDLRGGSWLNDGSEDFRCDFRAGSCPPNRLNFLEFRIVRFN
jgi:formylglycine-generating enzyme required for sulfatase activity